MNDHHYGSTHIRLTAYKATYISGTITLVDHDEYRWVFGVELQKFAFAPADIKFVKMLEEEVRM